MAFKEQVLRSAGEDTAYTRLFDFAGRRTLAVGNRRSGVRQPVGAPMDGRDAEILARREELASDVAAARAQGDPEMSSVYMGQGVGNVSEIRPAAEVVRNICDNAERILRENPAVSPRESTGGPAEP